MIFSYQSQNPETEGIPNCGLATHADPKGCQNTQVYIAHSPIGFEIIQIHMKWTQLEKSLFMGQKIIVAIGLFWKTKI